jgi:DNA-binding transcriptional LysR family regulator
MNLTQLKALVAVEDRGTFTGAAAALATVQSNVSSHIAHLERELGVVLVDRATTALTAEGKVVSRRARRIIAECTSITIDLDSVREPTGPSRVGMIGTTARWLAPDLLGALTVRCPGVHLILSEATSTSLIDQLMSSQVDVAVFQAGAHTAEPIAFTPLFDEDLLLVVPLTHQLCAEHPTSVGDLEGVELILPPPGTAYRPNLDAAAEAAGVKLRAMAEFDGVRLIASLTFDGYGPSILPATAIPTWLRDRCRIVPIEGLGSRRIAVARLPRVRLSAASEAVVALATELVTARADGDGSVRPCARTDHAEPSRAAC